MKRLLLWSAVAAYAGMIFYLSSLPDPLPRLTSGISDKVLHAIEYGGLALLVALALFVSNVRAGRALLLAVIAASLYAGSDEIHQYFVPGRHCDIQDWIADSVGAGAGALIALFPRRRSGRSSDLNRHDSGA